jgi:uncharacterized protein
VTLIDTGPLVALIDKADQTHHQKCTAAFRALRSPILTTWPCLTEALYFLGDLRGWKGQAALWKLFSRGAILIHSPGDAEWKRVKELMEQYKDTPMDFADASLVVLAELRGVHRVLTLDRDFYIYKIQGKVSFDVVPLDPA